MVLQLTVADVMTKPVLTVRPDTPLQQAVQIISDHHVSGLPVVDAEGRLIGELTEQDLMVRESGVTQPLLETTLVKIQILFKDLQSRNYISVPHQVHSVNLL